MENHIITFLALLWACFATEEDAPSLRKRDLSEDGMKAICVDLDYNGYVNKKGKSLGKHTLHIMKEKARWMRRWPGARLDGCTLEDELPLGTDTTVVPYCRKFGGDIHGTFCTMWVPAFFGDYIMDTGSTTPGACTGKNVGDRIDVIYDDAGSGNGNINKVFCMQIPFGDSGDEYHSVDIYAPSDDIYDWFSKRADYPGECDPGDEVSDEDNVNVRDFCVRIDKDWYNVETVDFFEDWWYKEATVKNGHCKNKNAVWQDTNIIDMYHYDDGIDYNEDVFCMKIPVGDSGDAEYHSVKLRAHSSVIYDWFWDQPVDLGECDPDDDFDEDNVIFRDFCVKIDGDWYNVETVDFFEDWWHDKAQDFENGHCDSNNIFDWQDTIDMYHYGDNFNDNYDVFCMNLAVGGSGDEYHSVKLRAPSFDIYDWFWGQASDLGECNPDDDFDEDNVYPSDFCVRIDGDWYNVETVDFFGDWLEEKADQVLNGHCYLYPGSSSKKDTIKLYHVK